MVLALALGNLSLCAALFFYPRLRGSAKRPGRRPRCHLGHGQAVPGGGLAAALPAWRGSRLTDPGRLCRAVCRRGAGSRRALWERPAAAAGGATCSAAGRWPSAYSPAPGCSTMMGLRVVAIASILGGPVLPGRRGSAGPPAGAAAPCCAVSWSWPCWCWRCWWPRAACWCFMPDGWEWISNAVLQGSVIGAFYLLMLSNGFGYLLLSREQAGAGTGAAGSGRSADRCAEPARLFPGAGAVDGAGAPAGHADRAGASSTLTSSSGSTTDYGHPVGDMVLRQVVDVCKSSCATATCWAAWAAPNLPAAAAHLAGRRDAGGRTHPRADRGAAGQGRARRDQHDGQPSA
jgi:hypothetical protein